MKSACPIEFIDVVIYDVCSMYVSCLKVSFANHNEITDRYYKEYIDDRTSEGSDPEKVVMTSLL